MTVGLYRSELDRTTMLMLTTYCITCGADIVVGGFDRGDDFCPQCAMALIHTLERQADDLEHDVKDLKREIDAVEPEPTLALFVVTAERPPIGRERKARLRRLVVLAESEAYARIIAQERLGSGEWTIQVDERRTDIVELGAA
jgi:hypothetical protein